MSPAKIQSFVIEVLREVQTLSGREWVGLDPSAKPIGDLEGFDSLSGVEATVMIEESLGLSDLKVDSVFVSENGKRALTVEEIVQRIAKLSTINGGKK